MKNRNLLVLIILFLVIACQKEHPQNDTRHPNPLGNFTLAEAQQWYQNHSAARGNQSVTAVAANHPFELSDLNVNWHNAESMPLKKGNYWIIALSGQPIYQQTTQGYRKLALQKDSTGQIHAWILEIIPEGHIYQRDGKINTRNFTGSLFIYNDRYQLTGGRIYVNGIRSGIIKFNPGMSSTSTPQAATLTPFKAVQITQNCQWYDNNYIDANGELVVFSQQVCTYDMDDEGDGGGSFDGGTGDFAGNAGGGGGTAGQAPAAPTLPGENKPKVDPKKLMDCFGNIPDKGATFKVTVYVQQPWPGTSFAIGPNSVGHTAIGLTKTNGSTSITQVIGFYPNATGLSKLHAPSKIVDNSSLEFDSSITYNINATQFQQIINYTSTPPATYDLYTFNCTNFVYSACQRGNITLPDPYSIVGPTGAGFSESMTPGALGGALESMKGNSNVNTTGGFAPNSKGPCN